MKLEKILAVTTVVALAGCASVKKEPVSYKPIFRTDGDDGIELRVNLESGQARVPVLSGDGTNFTHYGKDQDSQLIVVEGQDPTFTFDRNTDRYFVLSDENAKVSYLMSVTDIDEEDGVDFKDKVSGLKWEKSHRKRYINIGNIEIEVLSYSDENKTVELKVQGGRIDKVYTADSREVQLAGPKLPSEKCHRIVKETDGSHTLYEFSWQEGETRVRNFREN